MRQSIIQKCFLRAMVTLCGCLVAFQMKSEEVVIDAFDNTFEYQGISYEILNKFVDPITLQINAVDPNLSGELTLPEEINITLQNPFSERSTTAKIIRIGDNAFEDSYLEKIVLPPSVMEIAGNAFLRSELKDITLQKGILSIGARAFEYTHFESVDIPESVIMLNYGCFMNIYFDLKRVSLPSTLRALGGNVFAHCAAIQDIYCYSVEPPIANDSDFGVGKWGMTDFDIPDGPNTGTCKIHVPEESISLYKNAPGWKNFENIVTIEEPTDGVDETLATESEIDYSVADGTLSVAAKAGDSIAIYDLNGICHQQVRYSDNATFTHSASGIYILKVNEKSIKISL